MAQQKQGLLPSRYQQVEYIQNDGTQYIDTNIIASENNSFEVKAQLINTDLASQTIWGGRNSTTPNSLQSNQLSCAKSNGVYQFCCGNNNKSVSRKYDYQLHTFRAIKNKLYIDDTLIYTADSGDIILAENNVYLFATNTAGTTGFAGGSLKMYYCKIWYEDTLVRHFIPCVRKSDGAIGMFDLIEQMFFENQGTGEFIKGDAI